MFCLKQDKVETQNISFFQYIHITTSHIAYELSELIWTRITANPMSVQNLCLGRLCPTRVNLCRKVNIFESLQPKGTRGMHSSNKSFHSHCKLDLHLLFSAQKCSLTRQIVDKTGRSFLLDCSGTQCLFQ